MMKSVRISNNVTRSTKVLDTATTTVRDAFAAAEIECSGMISINGVTLAASELNDPIDAFIPEGANNVFIASCAKLDNAYTVNVLADTAIITSAIKPEDLALIERAYECGLVATDPDTDEETFRVTNGEESSVSEYGIVFTVNNDKLTAKINLPAGIEDRATYIAEKYYAALDGLKAIEENVPNIVDQLRQDYDAMKATINILD